MLPTQRASEVCRERSRQAMMNDDVGQQRLHAAEQRGSSAGEQPSVATRVEAAQEGPEQIMNQASAASSAREAPVASSARNVKTQKGKERPNGGRCRREREDLKRLVCWTTRISRQLTSHRWASAKRQ